MIIKCKECGEKISGRDEYETEIKFGFHAEKCPSMQEIKGTIKNMTKEKALEYLKNQIERKRK